MFELYLLGDMDLMKGALNAIAAFFLTDSYVQILKIGAILGLLMAAMKPIMQGQGSNTAGEMLLKVPVGPWSLIMPILIIYLAIVPKVTIWIVPQSGATERVDNVPSLIGVPMAITSQIGRSITEGFEVAFQPITGARVSSAGFLDSLFVLDSVRKGNLNGLKFNSLDQMDVDRTLTAYYLNCVTVDLDSTYPPPTTTRERLMESTNLLAALSIGAYANLETTLYMDSATTAPGGDISETCYYVYDKLWNKLSGGSIDSASQYLKANIFKKSSSALTASDLTQEALDTLGLNMVTASTALTTSLISKNLQAAEMKHAASQGANATGYAAILTNAETSRNVRWITEKSLFEKYAKPFMAFIEVLALGTAPLLPFLMLVGNLKAIVGWLTLTAWISMWGPILSLVNYYVITKCQADLQNYMQALIDAGVTDVPGYLSSVKGLEYISGATNEWLAMGAMLAASTPVISMAMLTGGMSGLTGMASSISKSDPATSMSPVARPGFEVAGITRIGNNREGTTRGGIDAAGFAAQAKTWNNQAAAQNVKGKREQAVKAAEEKFQSAHGEALSDGLKSEEGLKASRARSAGLNRTKGFNNKGVDSALQEIANGFSDSAGAKEAITEAFQAAGGFEGKFDAAIFKAKLGASKTFGESKGASLDQIVSQILGNKASRTVQKGVETGLQQMGGKTDAISSQAGIMRMASEGKTTALTESKAELTRAQSELSESDSQTATMAGSEAKTAKTAMVNAGARGVALAAGARNLPGMAAKIAEGAERYRKQGAGAGGAGGVASPEDMATFDALMDKATNSTPTKEEMGYLSQIFSAGAFTGSPNGTHLTAKDQAGIASAGKGSGATTVTDEVKAAKPGVTRGGVGQTMVRASAIIGNTEAEVNRGQASANSDTPHKDPLPMTASPAAAPAPAPAATPTAKSNNETPQGPQDRFSQADPYAKPNAVHAARKAASAAPAATPAPATMGGAGGTPAPATMGGAGGTPAPATMGGAGGTPAPATTPAAPGIAKGPAGGLAMKQLFDTVQTPVGGVPKSTTGASASNIIDAYHNGSQSTDPIAPAPKKGAGVGATTPQDAFAAGTQALIGQGQEGVKAAHAAAVAAVPENDQAGSVSGRAFDSAVKYAKENPWKTAGMVAGTVALGAAAVVVVPAAAAGMTSAIGGSALFASVEAGAATAMTWALPASAATLEAAAATAAAATTAAATATTTATVTGVFGTGLSAAGIATGAYLIAAPKP